MTNRIISLLYLNRGKHLPADELSILCDISERALRKYVEQIRNENLIDGFVLCSDESGYWISDNADEINSFLRKYLGAAFTTIKTAQSAKKFLSEQQTKEIQLALNF